VSGVGPLKIYRIFLCTRDPLLPILIGFRNRGSLIHGSTSMYFPLCVSIILGVSYTHGSLIHNGLLCTRVYYAQGSIICKVLLYTRVYYTQGSIIHKGLLYTGVVVVLSFEPFYNTGHRWTLIFLYRSPAPQLRPSLPKSEHHLAQSRVWFSQKIVKMNWEG